MRIEMKGNYVQQVFLSLAKTYVVNWKENIKKSKRIKERKI
jgi:hypothetical protein